MNILNIAAEFSHIFERIWHYNLITVNNNDICVSNIILAVILFLVGVKYSQKVNDFVKNYVNQKVNTDLDTVNAVERLAVYLVYIVYTVIGLQIANVPLSAFAFVSGALLLGVSLGAQNIFNNLISGLIIMIEKPVKIGDIVEVGGTAGIVTTINARCIIVTNFANIDILVPNSKLLENNIVNWTYSNSVVRSHLEIKVVHHSDHDIVMNALKEILRNNILVLRDPAFSIYLLEITELGARYEINYYCDIKDVTSLKQVKSEINMELFKKFSEQKIEFAVYFYPTDLLNKDSL